MRVLGADESLRALLARQLLLERADLPVPRALHRLCGLQTQHAPSGYLGLYARLAKFDRADLTAMLHDGRVVQAWAMRSTIHMLARRDHGPFTAAVRTQQRAAPPPRLRDDEAAFRADLPGRRAGRRHLDVPGRVRRRRAVRRADR